MIITIQARNVYGNLTYYPICDRAKLFAAIAKTQTLTKDAINKIAALGFEIVIKGEFE